MDKKVVEIKLGGKIKKNKFAKSGYYCPVCGKLVALTNMGQARQRFFDEHPKLGYELTFSFYCDGCYARTETSYFTARTNIKFISYVKNLKHNG